MAKLESKDLLKVLSIPDRESGITTAEWKNNCVLAFLTRRGGPWLRDARRRSPVITS